MKQFFFPFLFLALCGCSSSTEDEAANDKVDEGTSDSGSELIKEAIEAHGGALYDTAHYCFTFRDTKYTFENNGNDFKYSRLELITGQEVLDVMTNENFTRTVDGESIYVSEDQINNFRESINSVVYFATLPHKLSDASVISKDLGTTTIKDVEYAVVQVTFTEEGGGTDFQDEYMYWFNKETKYMDYLAYTYQVNGGGVRFRSAFNQKTVDGIRFQDYVNYEAKIGTPLEQLPALFEEGALNELSIIATENVMRIVD